MRHAFILLSLIGTIVGEAPYHLPRPGANVPALQYPVAPVPPPQLPQYIHQHPPQQAVIPGPAPAPQYPQQIYTPNFGYNYAIPQPAPQPLPRPAPAPAPAPVPIPQYQQPVPYYHVPPPAPQPQPIPEPIAYPQPNTVYGSPQIDIRIPSAPQQPIFNPTYITSQTAPQPEPAPLPSLPASVNHQQSQYYQQQQYQQSGYNYQQPIQPAQPLIQNQPLSSYQADSNQYRGANDQVHRDALDSIVVNRLQNIIKDDEHSVARNAGYQSLVSGVSLESAKPSVEILSFAHTSSLASGASSSQSSSISSPSTSYSQPAFPNQSVSSGSVSSSYNFLPQSKPATGYGLPN